MWGGGESESPGLELGVQSAKALYVNALHTAVGTGGKMSLVHLTI